MNKKGFFMVYLLVFTILAISIAIYISTKGIDNSMSIAFSDARFALLKNSNSIYEEFYFRNEALRLAVNKSVFELGKNGGSLSGELTNSDNYKIWYRNGNSCWPSKSKLVENYLLVLERELDFYTLNDYDLKIEEELDKFRITTGKISVRDEEENYKISSASKKGIESVLDYNFEDFLTKVDNIQNILNKCKDDEVCWNDEKNKFDEWFEVLNVDGKVYKFELSSRPFGDEEVIIRGAVDFSEGTLKC